MGIKGSEAKELIIHKLQQAFGDDWIGEYSKKYYVWAMENGEKVQIAISLTCPKVPIGVVNSSAITGERNFEEENILAPTTFVPAEITQEEKDNIAALMERLGL